MNRLYVIALLAIFGCASSKEEMTSSPPLKKESKYLRWVGDSQYDSLTDDPNFKLCNHENLAKQYFNIGDAMEYEGEKPALVRHFLDNYQPVDTDQSGYLRIRFLVNCDGKTGRFRLTQSDINYQEITFDKQITDQLLALTQSLDGWKTKYDAGQPVDYYQYLIFKIQNGHLTEIMP